MQKKFHEEVCDIFMNRPLNSFLGRQIEDSFVKMPSRNAVVSASFCVKMIPDMREGFHFISGVNFENMDSKMYLLLDNNL